MWKAVVAIVSALVFVLPGATAFTDTRSIEPTSLPGENTVERTSVEQIEGSPALESTDALDRDSAASFGSILLQPSRGTVYVDDNADPSWYDATHVKTIQEGVNNATAGDTVYVYTGTYAERVVVNKQVSLIGENRDTVIVNGGGTGNVFYITTPVNGVSISGFSITYGTYGVYSYQSSNNHIMDCKIYSNQDRGIHFRKTSLSSISNCSVYNNKNYGIIIRDLSYNNSVDSCVLANNKNGVFIATSFNDVSNCALTNHSIGVAISLYPAIKNCSIVNCDVNTGGIHLDTASNCSVINSTSYNHRLNGIYVNTGKYNTIQNCTAYNNTLRGLYIYRTTRSKVINCTAWDNKDQGIYLYEATYNTVENCESYGNTLNGIYLQPNSNYNNITNCDSYNNMNHGLHLLSSSNNNIMNFNVYNNLLYGIYFVSSGNNKLRNTMVYDNAFTFSVDGTILSHFYQDIDPSNTVNGKTIYYLVGQSNLQLGSTHNIGYLGLVSCNNITASNSDIYGLVLVATQHSTISNVDIHLSAKGIFIWQSSYNDITGCSSFDNQYGVYLNQATSNNITDCDMYNNSEYGIYLDSSLDNTLRDNSVFDNGCNFGVDGAEVSHFSHDIDQSNTVNGKPMYYLVGQSNLFFDETHNIGYLGLVSCSDITVENSDVSGVLLVDTTDSLISNVSSHDNRYGIYIRYSSDNTIMDCVFSGNFNRAVGNGYGVYVSESSHNDIINCDVTLNDKYGVFLLFSSYINITQCNVYNNLGLFSCQIDQSSFCDISDCAFYNNSIAVYFATSTDCNITNSTFYDNGMGMTIEVCSNISVLDSTVYNNGMGIDIEVESYNVNVVNCDAYNNENAIQISWYSQYCNIINCNSYNNTYGISLGYGWNNAVTYCNIFNNEYGLYIMTEGEGSDNVIHHNNFVNNVQNVYCDESIHIWDDGSEGNFWSDYTGIDQNGDGIGDTPYMINEDNEDVFPLMDPLNNPPPIIANVVATPEIQVASEPVNITCLVTDSWGLVDAVSLYVSGPEGFFLNVTMNSEGDQYWYEDVYTTLGVYFYHVWATDAYGSGSVSDTFSFVVTEFDKPTSAVTPLSLWKKTVPFTITATAYDNSGVANVTLWFRYSTDGLTWTDWATYGTDEAAPWSWSFTGSDGYYRFYSIAVDDYGNIEEAPSTYDTSTGIDTVKPVTTIALSGTMGGNGWYTSGVTVSLSATDMLSGVESTWYQIDAGYWQLYSTPFMVSSEGQHTVSYYSFDQAGNIEVINSVVLKIDMTAPVTSHVLEGVIGSEGWYITNVTVTLSASDESSGVDATYYELNDGGWILYTGSFDVVTDGEYTLYYYSIDVAGNTETTKQVAFSIEHDVAPPVTTHEFNGIAGENNWFISTVIVTLDAIDTSAGVASTMYKLNDGAWTTYSGAFFVSEDAEHTLWYYSVDMVGNTEETVSVALKIDQTAPVISLTVEKTGLLEWLLTTTVSDATSGVSKVEFYVDGEFIGEVTEAPYEWVYSGTGHMAQAIVVDNAGNEQMSDQVQSQVLPGVQGQSLLKTTQDITVLVQRMLNLR